MKITNKLGNITMIEAIFCVNRANDINDIKE